MACSSGTEKRIIRAFLKRIIGKPIGSIIPLSGSETVIGRSPGCGICVPDFNVSRNHCSLNYTAAGWTITDNGGINGTYLNGNKLQTNIPAPLKDGMVIFIGLAEDSPCAFVFLQNIDGPHARIEDKAFSQELSSRSTILRDMITSPFKREANPHTIDADPSKRFKTEYFISQPVIPGMMHSSPRRYNPRADRLLCIVGPSDPATPGPSLSIECGSSSEFHREHRGSMLDRLTCIVRSSEPIPGPSLSDEQVDSEGNGSDCSISSLDSLRTRIRKKKKRDSRNLSRSFRSEAGPAAEASNGELDDCLRMLSPQKPEVTEKLTIVKGKKTVNSQSAKGMEWSPSQQDSENSQNSESLLPFENPNEDFQVEKQSNKSSENGASGEEESTILCLKERVLKLQKRLLVASLELKNLSEKNNEQKRLIEVLKSNEGISQEQLLKVLEDELCCNICTEILIKPTTLNCAHTFCEHCISVWKKKKKQCPMCRESISSETGIRVLDNLISKAVEHLDQSYQTRRSEIMQSRVEEKVQIKKKGRKTRQRSSQIRIQRIPNNFTVTSPTNLQPQSLQLPDFGRIEMVPVDVLNANPQSSTAYPSGIEIQLSDGSDSSVEGSGYYGGFGRCFNCGRRGHWSNGCPN